MSAAVDGMRVGTALAGLLSGGSASSALLGGSKFEASANFY